MAPLRVLLLASMLAAPAVCENLSVSVNNIPTGADRIAVALDATGIQSLITAELVFTPGTVTATEVMNVPAGFPYRVRVIAFNGQAPFNPLLRDGVASVAAIPSGGSSTVTVNLGDITVTPDAANPASAPGGTAVTLRFNINDPGQAVSDALMVGVNFTGPSVSIDNGNSSIGTGTITSSGNNLYVATVTPLLGINPLLLAYNLVVRMRWGTNSPELYSPPVGSPALQLNVTTPASVNVTVNNIPAAANILTALVDGPGIATALSGNVSFTAGSASASVSVAVPPGGPYRVRAYVTSNVNSLTPNSPVLGDGETTSGILGAATTSRVTINLAPYQITVDPSTPVSWTPGTPVTLRFNISDPGEVVEGQTFTLNVSPTSSPIDPNAGTHLATATPVKVSPGVYTLVYQVNLPAGSPVLFYAVFSVAPYYFGPASGSTWQITVNVPCTFTLSPVSATIPQGQTSGSFGVTANSPGCPWNVQSPATWLTIFPGAAAGTGMLFYIAQANPGATARTAIVTVGGQTYTLAQLGTLGTPPAVAKVSVFRGNGGWIFDTNGNFAYDAGDQGRSFGLTGDLPVAGDWTGNGQVRIGVFRAGVWFLDLNNNGQWDGVAGGDGAFAFGAAGDIPVVGDWTGDGKSKLGVFRCPPAIAQGNCSFILDAGAKFAYDPATAKVFSYGLTGDQPAISNWSGAGQPDRIGVFRAGLWIVDSNGDGVWEPSDTAFWFGTAGDFPVTGDWTANGVKRIGIFRPSLGQWVLDLNGSNSFDASDLIASFGVPGDFPVVGSWTLP